MRGKDHNWLVPATMSLTSTSFSVFIFLVVVADSRWLGSFQNFVIDI